MADSIEKLIEELQKLIPVWRGTGENSDSCAAFELCSRDIANLCRVTVRELSDNSSQQSESALPAVRELIEAAKQLMADNEEYVRINNLGDPFHNHNMKRVRAALEKVEG
jgi:hypothetical protein